MACCQAINRIHVEDGGGGEKLYITSTEAGPLSRWLGVSQRRHIVLILVCIVFFGVSFGKNG